jgi:hypothetical protein
VQQDDVGPSAHRHEEFSKIDRLPPFHFVILAAFISFVIVESLAVRDDDDVAVGMLMRTVVNRKNVEQGRVNWGKESDGRNDWEKAGLNRPMEVLSKKSLLEERPSRLRPNASSNLQSLCAKINLSNLIVVDALV